MSKKTLREKLVAYVKEHPGQCTAEIAEGLGHERRGVSGTLSYLFQEGTVERDEKKEPFRYYDPDYFERSVDEPPEPVEDASCDPIADQRMDAADVELVGQAVETNTDGSALEISQKDGIQFVNPDTSRYLERAMQNFEQLERERDSAAHDLEELREDLNRLHEWLEEQPDIGEIADKPGLRIVDKAINLAALRFSRIQAQAKQLEKFEKELQETRQVCREARDELTDIRRAAKAEANFMSWAREKLGIEV